MEKERFPYTRDDLKVKRREKETQPEIKAVIIFLMDTSGSMEKSKLMIAKVINGRLVRHLRRKYKEVELVFIVHESDAKEVPEKLFFEREGSGGTHFSSGYELALKIIKDRFNPAVWNIYLTHTTDGENVTSDNPKTIELLTEILKISNLVGYFETKPSTRDTSMEELKKLENKFDNFKTFKVIKLGETGAVLEEFLKDE